MNRDKTGWEMEHCLLKNKMHSSVRNIALCSYIAELWLTYSVMFCNKIPDTNSLMKASGI